MFIPFDINSSTIKYLLSGKNYSYDTSYVTDFLQKHINRDAIKQSFINGTDLQDDWFPTEPYDSRFDVFISHAHADQELVKSFAGFLYQEYGLRSFIDSVYWGYANDLIDDLNEEYSKVVNPRTKEVTYDYETGNYLSSNVHAMLSMALMKMMDCCECLIFIDSTCSLYYLKGVTGTISPWIYEEMSFAKRLRVNIPERHKRKVSVTINENLKRNTCFMCFSATESHQATFWYKVDRHNFKTLEYPDFGVLPKGKDGYYMLDKWYMKYGIDKAIAKAILND